MSTISRREFLAGATAAAGAATLLGRLGFAADTAPKLTKGTDVVTLGKSGVKTTVLGIGTGTRGGREQRELGETRFVKLARHAYDRGIRYIDTADRYRIHPFVRAALKEIPREEIFIQTKSPAKDAEKAKADIERFRQELGIDYIDSLLMHCMTTGSWPGDMRPVMDVLQDAKQKGIVRAVGVSCHGLEPLVASVDSDWIDVHLVRINPLASHMDVKEPEEVSKVAGAIQKMHRKKRGVIGMKVFGEGDFQTRQKRLESLKYVLGLGAVHAFTIGFGNADQIDETLDLIEEASA
ncbi:MAG: aldo/keto reductase [Planctomycetota bacterium]|jgi:predicted aldo/keto reductase-like oxidoreductase